MVKALDSKIYECMDLREQLKSASRAMEAGMPEAQAVTFDVGDEMQWKNASGETEIGVVTAVTNCRVDVQMTTIGGSPRAKPTNVFFEYNQIGRLTETGRAHSRNAGKL